MEREGPAERPSDQAPHKDRNLKSVLQQLARRLNRVIDHDFLYPLPLARDKSSIR
jgi:hypothetical protein